MFVEPFEPGRPCISVHHRVLELDHIAVRRKELH